MLMLSIQERSHAEARRARSKKFWIKKYTELCDLCASVVNFAFPRLVAAQPRCDTLWLYYTHVAGDGRVGLTPERTGPLGLFISSR